MLCTVLLCLKRHRNEFGRGKSVENGPSSSNLANLDHSDHHFGRYNHAARCFRAGQGCLGPDQHSCKLSLRFVGRSVDGCPTDMCFFFEIGYRRRGTSKSHILTFPMSDFRFLGFQTCAKSLRVASICFVQSCFVSNGTEMHLGEGEVWKMDPPAPFSKFGSF